MRRAALLGLALVLTACGGGDGVRSSARRAEQSTTVSTAATTTTAPAPLFESAVAKDSLSQVQIYDDPAESRPSRRLPNPDPYYRTPRAFLVLEDRGEWMNVMLPMRPNGSTGWIHSTDVEASRHSFHIVVELGAFQLTAYDRDQVILQTPIGQGRGTTPTPGGRFFTTWLWSRSDQPEYGPYAFGLSGYSEVLYSFGAGDGQFGIHGTNDPSSLGRSVSNGCIRMSNDAITNLANLLPGSGVPVDIRA